MYYYLTSYAIINAITGNNFGAPIITTCIADMFAPKDRALVFSIAFGCAAVGIMSAPLGPLLNLSNGTCFKISFGLMATSGLALLFVPESHRKAARVPFEWANVAGPKLLLHIIHDRELAICAFISFCSGLPEAGVLASLLFFLNDRINFTKVQGGFLLFEAGISMFIVSICVMPVLLKFLSLNRILQLGLIANCLHLLGYAFAMNAIFVYAVPAALSSLAMVTYPTLTAMVSKLKPESEQGVIMGVMGSVKQLTNVFGPLLFGVTYNACKGDPMYFPQFPFIIGSGIVFIALYLSTLLVIDENRGNDDEIVIPPNPEAPQQQQRIVAAQHVNVGTV
jgi:predicted MFS family arabinose efflux permease